MRAIAVLVILSCSVGCALIQHTSQTTSTTTVAVHDQVPVIPIPEKPKQELMTPDELTAFNALPEAVKTKLLANDKAIKIFSTQCEAAISVYNNYATVHNATAQQVIQGNSK